MRRTTTAPRGGKAKASTVCLSGVPSATAKKPSRKRIGRQNRSNETPLVDWDDKENNGEQHDAITECRRLREQLERALVDRERQEDEIVALRALARSLKEEVEAMQRPTWPEGARQCPDLGLGKPRAFFKLDMQVEELRAENTALREQLDGLKSKHARLGAFADRELREHRLAAVKATAELQSASSQLEEEQAQCDRLRAQLARFKARGSEPVRFTGAVGPSSVVASSTRQLARAREELLLQCMSEEVERAPRPVPSPAQSTHQQPEDPAPRAQDGLELLGAGVAALETQLQSLHASLELPSDPPQLEAVDLTIEKQ